MLTFLPLGTTCARSDSLTVSLLPLSSCTLKSSSNSVLNLPPARNSDSSCVSFSSALRIFDSSTEKSNASSTAVGAAGALPLPLPRAVGCSSVRACERLTLPAFLLSRWEVLKCWHRGAMSCDFFVGDVDCLSRAEVDVNVRVCGLSACWLIARRENVRGADISEMY
jgi:hypothetical protein